MKKPLLWALLAGLILGGLAQQLVRCSQDTGPLTPEQELLSGRVQVAPVPGTVTLLDLGADACAPCRAMTPILAELSEEYRGRAAVIFIDVWEHTEQIEKFAIYDVPTQIIFDAGGNEVFRHQGALAKAALAAQLDALLPAQVPVQDQGPAGPPAGADAP